MGNLTTQIPIARFCGVVEAGVEKCECVSYLPLIGLTLVDVAQRMVPHLPALLLPSCGCAYGVSIDELCCVYFPAATDSQWWCISVSHFLPPPSTSATAAQSDHPAVNFPHVQGDSIQTIHTKGTQRDRL